MKNSGGRKLKKIYKLKSKAVTNTLLFLGVFLISLGSLFGITSNWANIKNFFGAGDEPAISKTKTDNGDGTYKLSLSVTGDAEKKAQKANVIVVFDTSSSMNSDSGTSEVTYTEVPSTDTGNTRYGKEGEGNDYFRVYRQSGNYTKYNGTPAGNTGTTYYGWYNNQFVQLTYYNGTWYRGSGFGASTYTGDFYTRTQSNTYFYYKEDGTRYTGTRYSRQEANQSRLEAAKDATNDLAYALLSNNGKDGNPADTIEIALVDFANTAEIAQTPTTDYDTFEAVVNSRDAGNNNRGTNWEAGFRKALDVNFGADDHDQTFVIFVSDGAPTFYLQDPQNTTRGGTGQEETDNMNTSYSQAVPAAQGVVNAGYNLYTIFAYGNNNGATRMRNITTAAGAPATNYYSAANTAALQSAFAEILAKIEMSGIGEAVIDDGTTSAVKISSSDTNGLLMIDESSYKFTVEFPIDANGKVNLNGKEATVSGNKITWGDGKELAGEVKDDKFIYTWTEANDLYDFAPEATNNGGNVEWDLSDAEVLITGAKYTVSFDVYPSQETYDLIADIKNEKNLDTRRQKYENLSANVKKYLKPANDNYTDFKLDTNTVATLSYDDTRTEEEEDDLTFDNPEPVDTEASEIKVKKEWENDFNDQNKKPITLELYRGTTKVEEMTLSDSNSWTDSKFISTGLLRTVKNAENEITDIQVLDHGHDYTLKEKAAENPDDMLSYHWELVAETVRPMLIDGHIKTLVEVKGLDIPRGINDKNYYKDEDSGREFYRIDGEVFYAKYEGVTANITATNYRKSNLNVMKTVEGDQEEGTEFKFNYSIKNEDDTEVWFSIWDTVNNQAVAYTDVDTDAIPEVTDPQGRPSNYFSVKENESGIASFYIKLQHGWNVRFINLGTGSEYTIEEEINSPYDLTSVEADTLVTSTKVLPVGAVENGTDSEGNRLWKYGDVIYTEKGEEPNIHYDFTYTPEITGKVTHGQVVAPNTSYAVNYVNEYPATHIVFEKDWFKEKPAEGTEVEFELYKNGQATGKTVTLDGTVDTVPEGEEAGDREYKEWEGIFKDLEVKDGNTINDYYVVEKEVSGYKATYEGTTSVIVMAKNIPEGTTEVKANIKVDDEVVETVTLNKDNNWTLESQSIDYINEDGTTKEVKVEKDSNVPSDVQISYVLQNRKVKVTNNETIEVKAKKVWDDANNQDNIRPTSVKFDVKDGDDVIDTIELNGTKDDNGETAAWEATFTDLLKYNEDGQEIEYTVVEQTTNVLNGTDGPGTYAINSSGTYKDTITITNKHTPETIEVEATKVWDDKNNIDGKRPGSVDFVLSNGVEGEEITITLDGTADNNGETEAWKAIFKDLPKYRPGKVGEEITYTLTETKTDVLTGTDGPGTYSIKVEGKYDTGFTVTNKHTPEKTEATVKKVWDDAGDQDGKRPTTLKVTLKSTDTTFAPQEETLSGNDWTKTVKDLPKYVVGKVGVEAVYSWDEEQLPDGYSMTSNKTEGTVTTITNSYTPEVTEATVKKVWNDAGNQDNMRPEELKVTLSSTNVPNFTPREVTLSGNDWTETIGGLPKNVPGQVGVPAVYEWTEGDLPDGYTFESSNTEGTVTTITNKHETKTTQATVKKVWNDANNQDNVRPETLKVKLTSTDPNFEAQTVTLSGDDWSKTIKDLPVNIPGQVGVEAEYSWEELDLPDDYEFESSKTEGTVTTITNKHVLDTTEATVKKVWNDANNQDNVRPETLKVKLTSTDPNFEAQTITLSGDDWSKTVKDLPKNVSGKVGVAAVYSWEEIDLPDDYEFESSKTEGKITTITNKHTLKTTEATVKKVWDDADNQDNNRPTTLKVTLKSTDPEFEPQEVTLEGDDWTETIKDLPLNVKGKVGVAAEYSWDEEQLPDGYEMTSNKTEGTITTITNSYTPEITEATVKKVWNDASNQDNMRPEELKVTLSSTNVPNFTPREVTLSGDAWTKTIGGLPKNVPGQEGVPAEYIWTEGDLPEGYEFESSNTEGTVTTITNKHDIKTTEATVKKVWNDANNQDNMRPTTLKVTLKSTDPEFEPQTITLEGDDWTETIKDLPLNVKGKVGVPAFYSWEEEDLPEGYEFESSKTEGKVTTITNKHELKTTEATVKKVWNDANNQDNVRPETLKVKLTSSDPEFEAQTVTLSGDDWTKTVKDLPLNVKGKVGVEAEYSWEELDLPDDYEFESSKTEGTVTTITNKHTLKTTEATVKKVWDDADDQDGKRPKTLKVTLKSTDPEFEPQTITLSGDDWSKTVKDLPLNVKGQVGVAAEYSWDEEQLPDGYEMTSNSTDGNITTITNSYTPEVTEATVKKVWDDAGNQDNKRPETLVVSLSNGTDHILKAENNWSVTVSGLPKYENGGNEIKYTWTEGELPEGYELTGQGTEGTITTITNSYTPEVTSATVKKVWNDANNQDNKRPTELKVTLKSNDPNFEPQEVTLSGNDWTKTINNLPKNVVGEVGVPAEYTWEEGELPEGYEFESSNKVGTITTITNKHEIETTEATVKKVWDDANNQDNKRPESLKVTLSSTDPSFDSQEVTLNDKNNWTVTVKDLPVNVKGKVGVPAEYSWEEEDLPEGYTFESSNTEGKITTITNKHVIDKVKATVKKVWDDADDQDGNRPESLKVTLKSTDPKFKSQEVTLDADNNWTETIKDLPKNVEGQVGVEAEYSWDEEDLPEGYTMSSNTTSGEVTTIKNSYTPEVTKVEGEKIWKDENDQDGFRPESITVNLLANGTKVDSKTVTSANGWKFTFDNLPKYEIIEGEGGNEIEYTVKEEFTTDPEGAYTTEIKGNAEDGFEIINTHTPETVDVNGEKIWDDGPEDDPDQDGLRPEKITVNLLANNVKIDSKEVEVGEDGKWSYSFTGLPKYEIINGVGGNEITYTVTEEKVNDYTTSINGYEITNTHNPFQTSISVKKIWNDGDDIDGKRSESIVVKLLADGIMQETAELNSDNDWSKAWTGLPRKSNGTNIDYTIEELVVPEGYAKPVVSKKDTSTTTPDDTTYVSDEQITVTNNHTPETVDITGIKKWEDANDQDGLRPDTIKVYLLADGERIDNRTTTSANGWAFEFKGLPKYEFENGQGGKEVEYTVEEEFDNPDDAYSTNVSGSVEKGFTITNTHIPEKTKLEGKKVWEDANDQDGYRPASVVITLYAGEEAINNQTVTSANGWAYSFDNLPKYEIIDGVGGNEIKYSVDELEVPDHYKKSKSGNNIINTHEIDKTEATVIKVWDDESDQDGLRPDELKVTLTSTDTNFKAREVTLNEENGWTATEKDLPVNVEGEVGVAAEYTWTEGELPEEYEMTSSKTEGKITTITNYHEPELIDVPISKTWIDNGNSEGKRPTEISVSLKADGEVVRTETISGSKTETNWKYTFLGLPKYKVENGQGGKEIKYTVVENGNIPDYQTTYAGDRSIINTIDDLERDIPVTKNWNDNKDQDGKRPTELKVTLIGTVEVDGERIYEKEYSLTLSGERTDDSWSGTFEKLPIFYKGIEISYTINEELNGTDYPTTLITGNAKEGYTITNTHIPEKTKITATKIWDDANDNDRMRPTEITIILKDGDKEVGRETVTADKDWQAEFTDLTKYRDGKEIEYTLEEEGVDTEIYTPTIDVKNHTITNTHKPQTITYEVTKIWDDFDNQDGKRPQSITVKLYADKVEVDSATVTPDEDGNWKYTFKDLPKYDQGRLIQYTITEEAVELYETDDIKTVENKKETKSIENSITNKHKLIPYNETGEITVNKVWKDDNNKNNRRPNSITIRLYANGKEYAVAQLNESNKWTYTFTDLPKYMPGEVGVEITYTIKEDKVADYKASIDGFTVTNTYDGPPSTPEIVPPNTGIILDMAKDRAFYELLMAFITLGYTLTISRKVND